MAGDYLSSFCGPLGAVALLVAFVILQAQAADESGLTKLQENPKRAVGIKSWGRKLLQLDAAPTSAPPFNYAGRPRTCRRVSSNPSPYSMGTFLSIYSETNFGTNTGGYWSYFPAPFPGECYNLLKPLKGSLKSAKVNWNVNDNKPNHIVCGRVSFWTSVGCSGHGNDEIVLTVPGGMENVDTTKFDYYDYNINNFPYRDTNISSISCSFYEPICPNPCASQTCPDNSVCVTEDCGSACYCNGGYRPKNGQCRSLDPNQNSGAPAPSPLPESSPHPAPPPRTSVEDSGAPALSPLPEASPPTSSPPSTSGNDHSDCLAGHNDARAAVGVGPLDWSDAAAQKAQEWSNTSASKTNCMYLEHGNADNYGQNFYRSSGDSTCSEAVQSWAREPQYVIPMFDSDKGAGSFTGSWEDIKNYAQVVWSDTTAVGCAKATCSDGGTVWTCAYSPPANVV